MIKKLLLFLVFGATTLFASPKIVVFDFGKVIGTSNHDPIREYMAEKFDLTKQELDEFYKEAKKNPYGILDEEFVRSYALSKNPDIPDEWYFEYTDVVQSSLEEIPGMLELVSDLKKKGYQTAMLSNTWPLKAELIRKAGFYDHFEPVLLSCDIDARKPHDKAYQILLDHLDVSPEDILFIDDHKENIATAHKMGMDGIHFTTTDNLKKELYERQIL